MSSASRRLVIVGDGEFAEIACEYFTHDSPHEVVGFAVEREYLKRDSLLGRPVVAFEEIEQRFPAAEHDTFVAITYTQLNRVRERLFRAAKAKGYRAVSYVSSRAFVWRNVAIGENCFVFEGNTLQYHCRVGDNVILWSGNHVGHRTVIRDHCFVSSHVVIAGYCDIGDHCFLGVNSSIGDNVTVAPDCVIGAGAVIVRNTVPGRVYRPERARASTVSSLDFFKVDARYRER